MYLLQNDINTEWSVCKRWSIVVSINPETPKKKNINGNGNGNVEEIRQVGRRKRLLLDPDPTGRAIAFRDRISHQIQEKIRRSSRTLVLQFFGVFPIFHLSNQLSTVAVKSSPL
jgi:hypothetical protein